ncbi:MAG TPA: hypothetical protein VEK11_24950 [Thermoanaerobaculia bacterium]|nr:hypothetical protein [Thermoanaerobaculia bacterium]
MPDTIPVYCVHCSALLADIAHVPGRVQLRCSRSDCRKRTLAVIDTNGHLNTYDAEPRCHIATRALEARNVDGLLAATQIDGLRRVRDQLLQTKAGKRLVVSYYREAVALLAEVERREPLISADLFRRVVDELLPDILAADGGAAALAATERALAIVRRTADGH